MRSGALMGVASPVAEIAVRDVVYASFQLSVKNTRSPGCDCKTYSSVRAEWVLDVGELILRGARQRGPPLVRMRTGRVPKGQTPPIPPDWLVPLPCGSRRSATSPDVGNTNLACAAATAALAAGLPPGTDGTDDTHTIR